MELVDPRLLEKAAGEGRIRGTVLDLFAAALARPKQAGVLVSKGLRAARYLHSRERRFVADGLYGLFREHALLRAWVGPDPLLCWHGWLVLQGLEDRFGFGAVPELSFAVRMGVPDPVAAQIPRGEAFLKASNERAPVVLRAQRDRGVVAAELHTEGIASHPHPLAPAGLVVQGRANLHGTAAYRAGRFQIQDAGSQLVAELVQPEGRVIDFCAGAGGKSLHLADLGAEVVACDVRQAALQELEKRARRSGARIRTHLLGEPPRHPASRVLVDAPCTGSGTLRRHPHHRLWLTDEEIRSSALVQGQILDSALQLVEPGGRLIYTTCSVFETENQSVVSAFLSRHPGWRLLRLADLLGNERAAEIGDGTVLDVAPDTHDTDGFFGAVLQAP